MSWRLVALRWSFCAYLAWASWQTLQSAGPGQSEHHLGAHGVQLLAAVELGAAVALLVPRLAPQAAAVLCIVFAIAGALSATAGELPTRFAYYAATAVMLAGLQRGRAPVAP